MRGRIVRVALPRPVEDVFHYHVPDRFGNGVIPGTVVHVPFGRRTMTGVVVELSRSSPVPTRGILALPDTPPVPPSLVELAAWTASYYQSPLGLLLRLTLPPKGSSPKGPSFSLTAAGREEMTKRDSPLSGLLGALSRGARTAAYLTGRFDSGTVEAAAREGFIEPFFRQSLPGPSAPEPYLRDEERVSHLTPEQEGALSSIKDAVTEGRFQATLIRGVTGSGKTEVYLRAARHALDLGRGVLLLVPEISLTPLLISRLERVAPGQVASLHSGMTLAARAAGWEAASSGSARLVVGVRSGVFAPVPGLGLIIVDEEHDASFRQEDTPSYSARDVAVKRAQLEGIPIVLGSATPSFESWHNARMGKYSLFLLPERVTPSPDPVIVLADMSGPHEALPDCRALSTTLVREIEGVLERGEQAMIFLNRRGFAPFLLCRQCRQALPCPNCSVTLTCHRGGEMVCHYCGHSQPHPGACPHCGGGPLKPVGAGTQKIEQYLAGRFPGARIDRLDRDALRTAGALRDIYSRMDTGETDILVGTQMLAKGHDFPGVTLAGILHAEQALDLPDFRSAERTFQIITQVAGRSGRGPRRGKVVVQTYTPDHYAIRTALEADYEAFYEAEAAARRQLGYPPFGRLGRIIVDGTSERKVMEASLALSGRLPVREGIRILGPSPAPLLRIRNRYRWHLLVLARSHALLARALSAARGMDASGIRVTTRVDPVQLL